MLGSVLLFLVLAIVLQASLQQGYAKPSCTKPGHEPSGCPDPTPPPSACVAIQPGDNLTAKASAAPAGTDFCIADGTYSLNDPVIVQSGDRFVGVYSDGTRPQVRAVNGTEFVFNASGSTDAYISNLAISGAVGTNHCCPYPGRGISRGTDLTVENIRAYNNMNSGIGGTGPNLVVRDSEIDHNGDIEFYADPDGGKVDSGGIKSVDSFRVYNSYIHDNAWTGVWCDIECNRFEVHDSTIINNGARGIFYEISTGPAIIEGNIITGNGAEAHRLSRGAGGLRVASSRNLDAFGNSFGNNIEGGFKVLEDSRSPVTGAISFHDNAMNGDITTGCNLAGVSCVNNTP